MPPRITHRPVLSPAESGRIGARRRWGPPRVLDMRDLTPEQVTSIVALAQSFRAANEAQKVAGDAR